MKKEKLLISAIVLTTILSLSSCVSGKKFKSLENTSLGYMEERDTFKAENISLSMDNAELASKIASLEKQVADAESSYQVALNERDKALEDYARLSANYDDLQRAREDLIRGNVSETRRLLSELQESQKNLQDAEARLRDMESNLEAKKLSLDELEYELEKRNQRLLELEDILESQKRIVQDLKNKVSEALLGFENDGLTVTMKDGKVYVSLDEKLLFKSGSYQIDDKGRVALVNLSGVLERNPDIQIDIEGHTDNVPYRGSGQLIDNWDLSVKRATTVVRVLLDNSSIDPRRLTASGRSEYHPIENSNDAAARQKNRRTEIILSPDLSGLYDIINNY